MSIWKNPKVELPRETSEVVFIQDDEVYSGSFEVYDEETPYFFFRGWLSHIKQVNAWCYKDSLIQQANNNLKNNAE